MYNKSLIQLIQIIVEEFFTMTELKLGNSESPRSIYSIYIYSTASEFTYLASSDTPLSSRFEIINIDPERPSISSALEG